MVQIAVLNEALRGGDAAKALELRTKKRLDVATRALRDAHRVAPSYVEESRQRHAKLCESSEVLNTQLDMLSESLEEITQKSQTVIAETRSNSAKASLLDQLALALPPFVQVSEALQLAESVGSQSFLELQGTLVALQAAIQAAQASNRPLLLRMADNLDKRAEETTAMMNARYMDLIQVRSNSVSTRYLQPDETGDISSGSRPAVGIASDALSNVGLLPHAINSIVADIVRNDVARGLRAATVCFSDDSSNGRTIEWSVGDGNDGELLEFDLDDLEGIDDKDIDALSESLDIANAAARAISLFDMFREVVLGERHVGAFALALQPWFQDHILPASGVVTSERRSFQGTGVSKENLKSRAHVTSISARIVEKALQARGSPEFRLVADQNALERTVGARCRIEALNAAKRAMRTFADAEHDNNLIVTCPISSERYIPRPHRDRVRYFPSCMVSQSAATVLTIFRATRIDAIDSYKGGSTGIGTALDDAAAEILRLYLQDVQVDYADDLKASYRLKALYYCDCLMLSQACKQSINDDGQTTDAISERLIEVAIALDRTGMQWMKFIRVTAEENINSWLDSACRKGSLGAYGTLIRLQRGTALSNANRALKEVVEILSQIIATETAEQGAATLCLFYLTRLCDEVLLLPEISADGCQQIDNILKDAVRNVDSHMELVAGMIALRQGASPPPQVERLHEARQRVTVYCEILCGRMEDLVTCYRNGKYEGFVDRTHMERFLRAIFEDTPLRAGFIRDLDVSLGQNNEGWSNEEWSNDF